VSFLAPLGLLLGALAIPIVLLWFLRQKRERRTVPTVFLWKKSAEEERVSPLIRNLTKSLLLLLQLVALLFLTLAAAETVLNLRLGGEARRVVILLDRSASMGTDEGGSTRLDLAREKVETLLSTFRRGDRAMLVVFDREARILSTFTDEEDVVRKHLAAVEPVDLETDPVRALEIAAASAAALPPGGLEVFLFSDGAFPPVKALPERLEEATFSFVGVGERTENAAITGLTLEAGLEGQARLFVRAANAGSRPAERILTLHRGDAAIDAREATLQPRSAGGAAFDLTPYGPGPFEVRLEPGDHLAADDRAFLVLEDEPFRRILLVTPGDSVLTRLKDLHPKVEVYTVRPDEATPDVGEGIGRFDLTIFDGVVPEAVRPGTGMLGPSALWFACVPPGSGVRLGRNLRDPAIVDWDRRHPLNRNVDWLSVNVHRASPIRSDEPLTTLLEVNEGPIVASLPGSGTRVVFGFRMEDSSLPLRVGFPILFANILERAFRRGETGEGGYVAAGDVLARALPPDAAGARIGTPGGREYDLEPLPDGTVSFSGTERAGFYRLEWPDSAAKERTVAVSFLSEAEADVAPRPAVEISGEARRSDPEAVEANLPLRRTLIVLAILILVAEWIVWLTGRRRRTARSRKTP